MPISKQEMGLLALQTLKVIEGNDTTPETNDTLVIEQAYDNVYARLASEEIVSWALTEDIPDLFIDPVMWLVAASRVTLFDVDPQTLNVILANSERSIGEITKRTTIDYVPFPITSEYF